MCEKSHFVIDLDVGDREFVVFVASSGCGTTLLRMNAGLEEISFGKLLIDGKQVNDVPSNKRGMAMVFQTYALYPHMSVAKWWKIGRTNLPLCQNCGWRHWES